MKVDWSQNPEHLAWCEEELGVKFLSERMWLSSVSEEGELLGVVVYTRFTPYNCEMSVAAKSKRFLSREVLRSFFGYPFHQLGLRRVTIVIECDNLQSLKFNQKLGFVGEGVLRHWYGENRHGLVLGMLREECKWL